MRMDLEERRSKRRPKRRKMDGLCECGIETEGNVGRGDAKPGCVETTAQKLRHSIELGKYAVEEEEVAFAET